MITALVRPLAQGDPDEVEIVEHKGLGHPDTLCDGAAEAAMRALYRAYVAEDGIRGEILEPMVLHVAGRAAETHRRDRGARRVVVRFGMSDKLGAQTLGAATTRYLAELYGEHEYSEETARLIDEEVQAVLDAAHARWRAPRACRASCRPRRRAPRARRSRR